MLSEEGMYINGGVTVDDALAELRELVAEKGADYVYVNPYGFKAGEIKNPYGNSACRNWAPDGAPSCGVGHWYARRGYGREIGEGSASRIAGGLGFSEDVAEVLQAFQTAQDQGLTWGIALADAERKASYLKDTDTYAYAILS